ncbi:MAG: acyltransferase, partial [Planctomycetaceae bacterium]
VIPVVLFHAGLEIFSGGYVGVDVFVVISGYLITSILINELEQGEFSIVRFYERRARRILPSLFFVMLVCIPFAWIWMAPSQLEDFGQSLVAVSLFASNILFWRESDYFAPAAEENPLLHTWSLAVEEQYYLFFPLLLLLAWRFGRSRVFYMIAAIAAVSLLLCESGWRHAPVATFYLAPTRAWELLAGSLCAFLQFGKDQKRNDLLAGLGLGLIVFAILVFDASTPFPSLYALAPVGGTVLIILFAANGTWTARLLSTRSLVGIGLISYSLYLWHQPLFAFARIYSIDKPSQNLMLCLALLSLALSYLSWQYIEKPFRKTQRRSLPAASSVLTASAAAIVLFLGAGVVTDAADGFYELKSTDRQLILMRTATASPKRDDCHLSDPDFQEPDASCEYFSRNVKFATFGDSHAVELAYALAERLRGYDLGIKHLSLSECAPSYGKQRGPSDCSHWTDVAIKSILGDDKIDTIIVSYRINAYLFGGHEDSYPDLPIEVSETERGMVWASYINILQDLVTSGKKVVLVLQAPELPQRMEGLIYDPMSANANLPGLSRDWWTRRSAYVRQHLKEIPAGVMIVDPANSFCDETVCYAGQQDTSYYFDDDHMSVAGAGIVADEILSKLGFQEHLYFGSDQRRGGAESLAQSARAGFEAMAVGRLQLAYAPVSAGSPGR